MTSKLRYALSAVVLAAAFVGAAISVLLRHELPWGGMGNAPYSEASFRRWIAESPARQFEFAEFESFLAAQDVAGVVPDWQLARSDSNIAKKCERPEFLLPPREVWPNVVAPLRIVRDHIKPVLGEVEVVSAYRTGQFNDCIGGASGSKHLGFHALDLIALEQRDQYRLFSELCRIRDELGPRSRFGLGAYFDPSKPRRTGGRFHVDGAGYRSWGPDYHATSSPCGTLI